MEESRAEKTLNKNKNGSSFSFSIEKILKRDDVKHPNCKRGNFKKITCCPRATCRDDETVERKNFYPCRPYKSTFLACSHPVCSVPTNPVGPSIPFHDFHATRGYQKYSSCSVVPHVIYPGECIKTNETFPYSHGLLTFARESGMFLFSLMKQIT